MGEPKGTSASDVKDMVLGLLTLAFIVAVVLLFLGAFDGDDKSAGDEGGKKSTTAAAKPKPRPKAAKFTGTSRSARVVARQSYGADQYGKNDEGVQLVRDADCGPTYCMISLRPTTPLFDAEEEVLNDTRPLFRKLFRLKTLQDATITIYGKVTTVGGKEEVSQVGEISCTRKAARQIDWSNVEPDGLKELCSWAQLANY